MFAVYLQWGPSHPAVCNHQKATHLLIVFPSAMGHGVPVEFHLRQELIHRLQCPLDPPLQHTWRHT